MDPPHDSPTWTFVLKLILLRKITTFFLNMQEIDKKFSIFLYF